MTPSFAFVGRPRTDGAVGRFFRTRTEQVVHGRVFETLQVLRDAVRAFIARDTSERLIAQNGHPGPHTLGRQHQLATVPVTAQPDRAAKATGPAQGPAAGRQPPGQMPRGRPPRGRPRRNRQVLAMTLNGS